MARELARNLQNQTGFRPPLRLENEEKASSSLSLLLDDAYHLEERSKKKHPEIVH